jgi:transglutaminase-like putative cysteine protease
VLAWQVQAPGQRLEQVDPFGNLTQIVTTEDGLDRLRIVVSGMVELEADGHPIPSAAGELSPLAYLAPTPLTRPDAALRDLAERHLGRHPAAARSLMDLASGIRAAVTCQPGVTDEARSAAEALDLGAGACQDQAHVLVACCRAARVPARYVSGYVLDEGSGAVASHAWADVWLGPEQGWLSLDVTHAGQAGARHCRLAVGRDCLDAAPVRGVRRGGGRESVTETVRVTTSQGEQP